MESQKIFDEAAAWMIKKQSAPFSVAEQEKFELWLNQSPEHFKAWEKAEKLMSMFDQCPRESSQILHDSHFSMKKKIQGGLFAFAFLCVSGSIFWFSDMRYRYFSDYVTAFGQTKSIDLEDGSHIQLNAETALDIQYAKNSRTIRLHYGEVFIRTAVDSLSRPFLVDTSHAQLQALGTVFNVQYFKKTAEQTCLGVVESAVKVTLKKSKEQYVLKQGEQLCFDQAHFSQKQALDSNHILWQSNRMVASETALAPFIMQIGRYYSQQMEVDPRLSQLKISGNYPTDHFDNLVLALESSYPIHFEFDQQKKRWIILPKK